MHHDIGVHVCTISLFWNFLSLHLLLLESLSPFLQYLTQILPTEEGVSQFLQQLRPSLLGTPSSTFYLSFLYIFIYMLSPPIECKAFEGKNYCSVFFCIPST